jgi:hypothetical protein
MRHKNTTHFDRMRTLHVEGKTHAQVLQKRYNAEQKKRNKANGRRQICFPATADVASSMIYLRREWGFSSATETVEACINFTMVVTRLGLKTLDRTVYDALVRLEQEAKDQPQPGPD